MSENENAVPATPRFSEMFRFADDSDLNEHLRELRAEAFAYGINLDLRVFPGPIPPSKEAELGEGIKPPPKRAGEIILELLTKHNLNMTQALNAARRAHGEKPLGDPVKLAKRQADFEKAYYGKLRHSEKGRKVVDLLRTARKRKCFDPSRSEARRIFFVKGLAEHAVTLQRHRPISKMRQQERCDPLVVPYHISLS